MDVSVVVVTYRRLETLGPVLEAWLSQASEVWLADCSGVPFKAPDKVRHVRFSPDPGSKARHAMALMTNGDLVFKADDDVMPKAGLVDDFLATWKIYGTAFYGVHGRTFNGPAYYKNTVCYSARQIERPVQVDFVGVCTMCDRSLLAYDLKGCGTAIEDLFCQCGIWPQVKKIIVPTTNYVSLPDASGPGCLYYNRGARTEREAFYAKVWKQSRAARVGQ